MNKLCIGCRFNNEKIQYKPCGLCFNYKKNKNKTNVVLKSLFRSYSYKLTNYYTKEGKKKKKKEKKKNKSTMSI